MKRIFKIIKKSIRTKYWGTFYLQISKHSEQTFQQSSIDSLSIPTKSNIWRKRMAIKSYCDIPPNFKCLYTDIQYCVLVFLELNLGKLNQGVQEKQPRRSADFGGSYLYIYQLSLYWNRLTLLIQMEFLNAI